MDAGSGASGAKQNLRRLMGAQRRSLDPGRYADLSLKAQKHLVASSRWKKAATVALYMPVRNEVDTRYLLETCWEEGRAVYLPLCSPEMAGQMEFHACRGLDDLSPGLYGILEPGADAEKYSACTRPEEMLLVVPGLAFGKNGTRLGQGGGYYDRILNRPEFEHAFLVGLAFSFQVVDDLPVESHDRPVAAVCTDKGFWPVNGP